MAKEAKLKMVALHVTNLCENKCPMCYATCIQEAVREGNLETLKQIANECSKTGVQEITLVGGDPARYSKIEPLIKHIHKLGMSLPILSNTHDYANSSVERVAPYVTSMEGTFHGTNAQEHDAFCRNQGAYDKLVSNLLVYDDARKPNQKLGAVLNVMAYNNDSLYHIVESLLEKGLNLDYTLIQRIAPFYRGKEFDGKLEREHVIRGFERIDEINKKLGIETVMVDAFPLCVVPEKYHQYVERCDWGWGTAAIDMDGNIGRCAMEPQYKVGNLFLEPLADMWQNSPQLLRFRSQDWLGEDCRICGNLERCGSGCAMSCGNIGLGSDVLRKSMVKAVPVK